MQTPRSKPSEPFDFPVGRAAVEARGLQAIDDATRRSLDLRWRQPGQDRRWLYIGLGITLLLHVLFALLAYKALWPAWGTLIVAPESHDVLQVRLIENTPATAAPAPVQLPAATPAAAPKAQRSEHEPQQKLVREGKQAPVPSTPPAQANVPADKAMTIVDHGSEQAPPTPTAAAPAAGIFNKDGQVDMPANAGSIAAPTPGYVAHGPPDDRKIMQHNDPTHYKATRFEKYFPPPGETALQSGLRHVMTPLMAEHDMDIRGNHMKCSFLGGCQNPPAPPSKKDGDERLSMAPASALTKDPHAAAPPTLAECIKIYRDEKPLPYGCPVDTPDKSAEQDAATQKAKGWNLP